MIIKRIAPLSCARIAAAFYGIVGLVIGSVVALLAASGQLDTPGTEGMPLSALGAAAVIVAPILYGMIGSIVFMLFALLYNALATILGGIEIEVEHRRTGMAESEP